jgi:hypothetical protein
MAIGWDCWQVTTLCFGAVAENGTNRWISKPPYGIDFEEHHKNVAVWWLEGGVYKDRTFNLFQLGGD